MNIEMAMCLISPKDYLSLFFLSGIKHRFWKESEGCWLIKKKVMKILIRGGEGVIDDNILHITSFSLLISLFSLQFFYMLTKKERGDAAKWSFNFQYDN